MMRLIAFNGQMFAGKTSAIAALNACTVRAVKNHKFAQPLYDIQEAVYNIIGEPVPFPKDRELLQWLGTDWGRKKDPNLWVNTWKKKVAYELESSPTSIITCDDCRFDNEAEVVRSLGGVVVCVTATEEVRTARARELGMKLVSHVSEAGIKPELVDFTLDNSGTPDQLREQVRALAKTLGL